MSCLGQLPALMQRGRIALKQSPLINRDAILEIQSEINILYQRFQPILHELRARWLKFETSDMFEVHYTAQQKRFVHCHYARMLAFGAAVALVINCVLASLGEGNSVLQSENERLVEEILELGHVLKAYRPLGAMSTTIWLGAAWVATQDPALRAKIEEMVVYYQKDLEEKGNVVPGENLDWYRRQFTLM